jgi:hypothetical protein
VDFLKSKRYSNQYGIGKLTLIVCGLVLVVSVFVASRVLPFYYYYYEIESHMHSLINVAGSNSDDEIKDKLMYHIKKMEIPVTREEIEIVRTPGTISIAFEYEEVFDIEWKDEIYEIHVFPFYAYAEGNF